MRSSLAICGLVSAALLPIVGCGRSSPPAPTTPPGPVESITGRERIGWEQRAGDAIDLATFRYAVYVDGVRSAMTDVQCSTTASAAGFPCDSRLPVLSAGAHTLELASFVVDGATLESPRSSPIRVIVTGIVASATEPWQAGEPEVTTDGTRLQIERLSEELDEPADAAFAPDGRLFVAERRGRVRVLDQRRLQAAPALVVDDVAEDDGGRLMAIGIDPQFERTHFVYLLHTAQASSGERALRISRYRELGGMLAERAVILDGMAAPDGATGGLRFGPDGLMYVALDGVRPARPSDGPASAGRILRLNADGSTPRDQAGARPEFVDAIGSPRGLAWDAASGVLWLVETGERHESRLSAVGALPGRPLRAAVGARYRLQDHAASIAASTGTMIPAWKNDLLIASESGRHILRVHIDPAGSSRIPTTERLLQDRVGDIRVVLVGPDGAIYFCTPDAIGRLRRVE